MIDLLRLGSKKQENQAGFPFDVAIEGIYPEDRDLVCRRLQEAKETGCFYQVEYRAFRLDGSIRTVRSRGRCSYRDGKPFQFLGATVDIGNERRGGASMGAQHPLELMADHCVAAKQLAEPDDAPLQYLLDMLLLELGKRLASKGRPPLTH